MALLRDRGSTTVGRAEHQTSSKQARNSNDRNSKRAGAWRSRVRYAVVFLAFALCALVPIAVVGVVSYRSVTEQLVAQAVDAFCGALAEVSAFELPVR